MFGIQEWHMERLTFDGLVKIDRELARRADEARKQKQQQARGK